MVLPGLVPERKARLIIR
jgi:glutathionyl-hydroquinone reductase